LDKAIAASAKIALAQLLDSPESPPTTTPLDHPYFVARGQPNEMTLAGVALIGAYGVSYVPGTGRGARHPPDQREGGLV